MRDSSAAGAGNLPSGGNHSSTCSEIPEIRNIAASDLWQELPMGHVLSALMARRKEYGSQWSVFRKSQKAGLPVLTAGDPFASGSGVKRPVFKSWVAHRPGCLLGPASRDRTESRLNKDARVTFFKTALSKASQNLPPPALLLSVRFR
jgi:hypothetical protein